MHIGLNVVISISIFILSWNKLLPDFKSSLFIAKHKTGLKKCSFISIKFPW